MEICIDSRLVVSPESTLFFALKGKNHNGHDYVEGLYRRGGRHFVISEEREEYETLREAEFVRVADVLSALQDYATDYRSHVGAEVIGVTGSNGKTIVKEWIYQLLADEFKIYRSPRSYNSQVGVPLSLCGIGESDELAVIEAGISRKGEMEKLERMIRPEIAVFTHFGDAHGENFLCREEKLAEKACFFKHASTVIGREGAALEYILSTTEAQPMVWGESVDADVKVHTLSVGKSGRKVRLAYGNLSFVLEIPFPDEASFENCIHAVCVALLKNVSPEKIVRKVRELQPIAMRMEIREGVNRSLLIHDYYNSDAASFHLALNTLVMQAESKEKVVILSDFIDTGSREDLLYAEVADKLKRAGIEQFIGIGEALMRQASRFEPQSRFYPDVEHFMRQESRKDFADKVILIKGARKFRFEYIAGFLQRQSHNTVLEVDMDAMVSNLNYFRSLLPEDTKLAVMVKAFSYGAGAVEVANLLQYHGANYLMVAFADEGVALRAQGIHIPIAVMNPQPDSFDSLIEFDLEPEIGSFGLLSAFDKALMRHGVERFPVHIKLNTGMNRSGFDAEEMAGLAGLLGSMTRVVVRSVFSHLAASDEPAYDDFTRQQARRFTEMADVLQAALSYRFMRHILNSGGIERFPEYSFDMVRLGIGLHGISAVGALLQPVSSFKTYVAVVRNVRQEETVGYGRKGVLRRDSRIAVVPVGYADGLSRRLGNGVGEMVVRGIRVPIVGNICMDTCMLDVTDVAVEEGDEVEIFGCRIPVAEVAERLGTIPYEVLTQIAQRVKRIYYKE